MKSKVIALVTTLLVCGSVGAYAAGGNTYFSGQPAQAVRSAVSSKSCPTSISNALNQVLASKASSSCPTSGSVNASAVQAAVQAAKNKSACPSSSSAVQPSASSAVSPASSATSSAKSGTSSSCKTNGCSTKAYCQANSCTNGTNCTNGSCTVNSNCAGNVYTYVVSPSGGSYSDWINSILNSLCKNSSGSNASAGTTSSKVTSSAPKPASSAPSASSKPASSSPASGSGYSAFQNEVASLVNQERTSRGLGALSVDSALTKTATLKSQDMAKNNYFNHTSPTYGSPFDMMKQFGITYRTAGENIAMGQTSPAQVMNGWMNSEGHRANILNSSFTKIGVGVAQNANGYYYWTQQFIG